MSQSPFARHVKFTRQNSALPLRLEIGRINALRQNYLVRRTAGTAKNSTKLFSFKGMYILGVYASKERNEIYGFILSAKDMKRNE